MPTLTVKEIADLCQGVAEGDVEIAIVGANALEAAGSSELSFVANAKAGQAAGKSKAGCLLVPQEFEQAGSWALVRVADPRRSFVRVLGKLYPPRVAAKQIHTTAIVAETARVAEGCSIGAYVTIGENTRIEANCVVEQGCHVGDGVSIGAGSTLHSHVTIYDGVHLGARVLLHAGCVIGADGFGFTMTGDHYEKFPQVGTVDIGDDVEIGANSCVDRAALGVTRIGNGTKIDNMVHIAHNCTIGKHVIIAAQAGLSGGVTVGDYAFVGGQTGVGDKARIDSKSIVAAKSGILTSQHIAAGEPVWGIPARPLRQHLKNLAHVTKLPAMRDELKSIERRVAALEREDGEA